MMQAALIEATGPASNIQYGDLPVPVAEGAQVLVKVQAVAVNPVDTYIRSGAYGMDLPMPFVVGCDLAGVVEAVGPAVTRFQPGDLVWGSNQGVLGRQGTFAEYANVHEDWLYLRDESVSPQDAAANALVGITAHLGLISHGRLQAGETVFIHGGAGGVGSTAVQMAKAAGARVIATAGNDRKVSLLKDMGVNLALNYKQPDVVERVQAFAHSFMENPSAGCVDLFWDMSREPHLDLAMQLMADHGRIILAAGRDARPQLPVGPFYSKCLSMHGFVMFKASPDQQRAAAEEINRLLIQGALKPRIAQVLPLSETARAHDLQEQSTIHGAVSLAGKLVLVPDALM